MKDEKEYSTKLQICRGDQVVNLCQVWVYKHWNDTHTDTEKITVKIITDKILAFLKGLAGGIMTYTEIITVLNTKIYHNPNLSGTCNFLERFLQGRSK